MTDERVVDAQASVTGKVVAPPIPARWVARPHLDGRLDAATTRRVTLVTGSAGSGKTALLTGWAQTRRAAWYTVDERDRDVGTLARGLLDALRLLVPGMSTDLLVPMVGDLGPDAALAEGARARAGAGALAGALREALVHDLVLVLDDLDELGPTGPAIAFVESLVRECPARLHVVLAGRDAPPFPLERLRGRGEVAEIPGSDLALDADEVAQLLADAFGDDARALGSELREITGGWPAAVSLAIDALERHAPAERPAALERLRGRAGPFQRYLLSEVLDHEPPEARSLLRSVAPLPAFDVALCRALGHDDADVVLADLTAHGMFVEPAGPAGWLRLTALVRDAVEPELDAAERDALRRRALEVLEARGDAEPALLLSVALAAHGLTVALLERHGAELVAAGKAGFVEQACASVPAGHRTATIEEVHGEALQVRGAWDDALACFTRVAADRERLPAALAWRLGLMHYYRGDLDDALDVFTRGELGSGADGDDALLLAWWAAALWRKSDHGGSRAKARAAFAAAERSGDDRALAAAHTALAMVAALEGDRRANDAHYLRALDAAQRAGDVLQAVRIRTNRASHFLDEGFYPEAIAEAEIAIALADPAGYATFHALALTNRGEAAMHLGRLEEAVNDFRAAQAIEQGMGARTVGYPLLGLADVHRLRGDLTLARAAYREAAALAEEVGDAQLVVPAFAGLARTLVDEDPEAAREAADRAVACGPGMAHAQALLASATVALAAGDRARAAAEAREAERIAAERRDRPAMAEGLEVRAALDPSAAVACLEEAVRLWAEIGDVVRQSRGEQRLARLRGAVEDRAVAEAATARLHELGVRTALARDPDVDVEVRCFGGFRIAVGGTALPNAAWQSRKARDLLKILLARRGRPTAREVLVDLLWPGEDLERVGNRLSVALSTIRATLDPDRRHPADRYVRTDKTSVGLDLAHIAVDLEQFLDGAERGLALREAGERERAHRLLAAVEPLYGGDFLEEDVYEEWAVPTRELARATYVEVARALAEDALGAGDHDRAARLCLRVLERDPYDEPAHLRLVETLLTAGRHGEARRHYRAYATRMAELGVEASPFPG